MQAKTSEKFEFVKLNGATEHLEACGYKVIRPFSPRIAYETDYPSYALEKLVVLDVETTGTDFANDKIIELGLVIAEYCPKTGNIFKVIETYNQLENPGVPISEASSKIHGITDDMVKNQKIDDTQVNDLIGDASLIIAHNASFDRAFVEKRFPFFKEKAWACSFTQIPWKEEGINSLSLEFIAYKFGFHFNGHRASNDCHALLEILHSNLPASNTKVLKSLLNNSNVPSVKLWAINSGYENKDLLKERDYRWNSEKKCWYRMISKNNCDEETQWLRSKIYKNRSFQLEEETIDAYSRFSERGGLKKILSF